MDSYVLGGYGVTFVVLALYAIRTILRGRALSAQLSRPNRAEQTAKTSGVQS